MTETWNGWIPKRPKGPDCKSGGNAFAGSNPAPPMSIPIGMELDSETRIESMRGYQRVENKMQRWRWNNDRPLEIFTKVTDNLR